MGNEKMTVLDALAACVAQPGLVAAQEGERKETSVMFNGKQWFGLTFGSYGKMGWSVIGLTIYPDEIVASDGTPKEWGVVSLADVEAQP